MRLAFQFCVNYRWILNCMLQIFVRSIKRHWFTLILHFLFVHENFSGSFFEKVHFSSSKIEFFIIFSFWLRLLFFLLLLMIHVTFIFFLNSIVMLFWAYIFSDEEVLLIVWNWHLSMRSILHSLCLFFTHESHLLMIWWSEYFFVLCFPCELRRENFTFNISIRSNIRYWESNTLVHHLSVQILSFNILLPLSWQKLDRIRIWEASVALLLRDLFEIAFISLNLIINQNCR